MAYWLTWRSRIPGLCNLQPLMPEVTCKIEKRLRLLTSKLKSRPWRSLEGQQSWSKSQRPFEKNSKKKRLEWRSIKTVAETYLGAVRTCLIIYPSRHLHRRKNCTSLYYSFKIQKTAQFTYFLTKHHTSKIYQAMSSKKSLKNLSDPPSLFSQVL